MNTDAFFRHTAQTTPHPMGLHIVRAEGIYLYDEQGKAYMDLISGIAVSHLGHGHPHIKEAIKRQVDEHLFVMVYGEYLQRTPIAAAEKLAGLLPPGLDMVYFVNSGTEANEAALKLAKRATGRAELVACHRAYHGSTHGSLSVSGNERKKYAFRPLLPDVRFIHFNRLPDLAQITERTAAVIVETVQGDAGVRIPDRAYMQALRARCTEVGALLILDEIQAGMGRTGTLFAFEQFGIVPDLLTLGKALGGGMPIGALVAPQHLMRLFTFDPMLGHITTFGGHPVCCAAALAALEVLVDGGVLAGVKAKGERFRQGLRHPAIRELRSIGLMFAVEMEDAETVQRVVAHCLEKGVIGYWFLSTQNSFRLAPPLTITDSEIDEACRRIAAAIDEATAWGGRVG
jgi:acetylornithine/succinyldiaminopimelate/putrescine aminotransferase